nr:hypothetical protein [Sicyoidochytrium minutum DNA virus]
MSEGTPITYWKSTDHETKISGSICGTDYTCITRITYTPNQVEGAKETTVKQLKLGDQTFIWTPETKWREVDLSGAVYHKTSVTY